MSAETRLPFVTIRWKFFNFKMTNFCSDFRNLTISLRLMITEQIMAASTRFKYFIVAYIGSFVVVQIVFRFLKAQKSGNVV